MAIYNTISSKAIIAEIFERYNPSHSGWTGRAVRWIGAGLQKLKIHSGYETVAQCINIVEFKSALPCDLKALLLVTDINGNPIYKSEGLNHKNVTIENFITTNNNSELGLAVDSDVLGNVNNAFHNANEFSQRRNYISDTYSLNPGFIHTPFEKGELVLYYDRIPCDCEGFPLVPDDEYVKEYLEWYVMDLMLLRGFKHQVINYNISQAKLEKLLPQARNSAKFPSIQDMELYKQQMDIITFDNKFTDFQINGKPRL